MTRKQQKHFDCDDGICDHDDCRRCHPRRYLGDGFEIDEYGNVYDSDGNVIEQEDDEPWDCGDYMSGRDADRMAEAHLGNLGFRGNKY